MCGFDVGGRNKKNRHPLFGKHICPTLTGFATDTVKSLSGPEGSELLLDVQSGYLSRICYRELAKLHSLQKQLNETKTSISNKLAKIFHLLPTKPSTSQQGPASTSTSSLYASRKRSRTDLSANSEGIKKRQTLQQGPA